MVGSLPCVLDVILAEFASWVPVINSERNDKNISHFWDEHLEDWGYHLVYRSMLSRGRSEA